MRKRQWLRLLTAVLAGGILLSGCASGRDLTGILPEKAEGVSLFEGQNGSAYQAQDGGTYETICENDRYTLQYRQDIAAIAVTDRQTGESLWDGAVTETLYPELATSTKVWKDYMQSLLAITYASKDDTRGNFVREYSAAPENTVETQRYANGLKLTVAFANSSIRLQLEIALEDDGLRLRIPAQGIEENGNYRLYAVELLPFFGAAAKEEEGYLFYPDGSGALSYFQRTESKHLYATPLTLDIYGPILQSDFFADSESSASTVSANPTAMLPVYGIKRSGRAFLAAAVEGEEYAQILVNPSINMSTIKLNRCSFSFIYREQYRVYLSNIVKYGENQATNLYGTRLVEDLLPLDREVKLFFLEGDQADYSGMAGVYRDYLRENGWMNASSAAQDALSLTLFMGAQSDAGLLPDYVSMTTLEQAQSILNQYLDGGVENLQVLLRGWTQHGYGYVPDQAKAASAVGGQKGLEALDRFAAEHRGARIYLEANLTDALEGKGRFSDGRDVIQQGNGSPVTDGMQKQFLITPAKVWENFQDVLRRVNGFSSLQMGYETLGLRLYQDQNDDAVVTRADTRDLFEQMLAHQERENAVEGGNLYALRYAQQLYNVPISASGNEITDQEIPWFSMVVYGSIPYSAEPGNLAYDLNQIKLKWIEYGCMPHFELAENSPTLLQDTDYNELFTCKNEDWMDRVLTLYAEFQEEIWPHTVEEEGTVFLSRHEILDEDLIRVTYSNGTVILLNYGDTAQTADGCTVEANDYQVIGGDEE